MKRALLDHRRHGGVAVMRLNRPEALNALNPPLLEALIAAVEDARRDPRVRCVVVTGNGRAFSAGGDLKAMLAMSKESFREYILLLQRLSAEMRRLAKPTIAAVNGYALAGGFELAVICDIRIAAKDAVFGLPDTAVGVSPTSGMTSLLPRIIGMGWAKHLTLTGETIDAAQAQRIGLVTCVVPAAGLRRAALSMARSIAAHPPLALRYVKLGFDVASDVDLHTALAWETDAEVTCFDTPEVRAHLRAFAGRKKAKRRAT
jgi:enoyl-CoA hydratase/carnithine racemase